MMPFRPILALFLLAALTAAALARQATPPEIEAAPRVAVTHHLSFPHADAQAIAFLPDGRTALVHLHDHTLDLGGVALLYRRPIVGAALALVTLALALRIRTIIRRPRLPGRWYCRRCNYDLKGHFPSARAAPPCPECGSPIHRPRPGRPPRARIAGPLAAWIATAALFAAALGPKSLYTDSVYRAVCFPSRSVAGVIERLDIRPLRHLLGYADTVVQIDLETGRTLGRILRSRWMTLHPFSVSPDGRIITLQGPTADTVRAFTSAGRPIAEVTLPGIQDIYQGDDPEPWSSDGSAVYLRWSSAGESGVTRWEPATGYTRDLFSTPGFPIPDTTIGGMRLRSFALLDDWPAPRFISWPSPPEAGYSRKYIILEHVEGRAANRVFLPSPRPLASRHSRPAVAPDGSAVYFIRDSSDGILAFDGRTFEPLGSLPAVPRLWGPLRATNTGLLLIPTSSELLVRDTAARAWRARLPFPTGYYGANATGSADGRWIAATVQKSMKGPSRYAIDLLLWQLDPPPVQK